VTRTPEHLSRLERLLAIEREEEIRRHKELAEGLSPAERAERGFALLDLEAVDEGFGLGGRILIDLERQDRGALEGRIDVGAVVELRPRRAEVEEPARGVVSRRQRSRLTVAFDRPPPPFVREGRLIVDLAPNDVTYERARAALAKTRAMEAGKERTRREILLGAAPPRTAPVKPHAPRGALNPEQTEATARALAAEDFFLVHGPPGTGKSHVLAEVAAEAAARGERIVATAASNAAVDHLLELCLARGLKAIRLGHPARITPALLAHSLDVKVEAHPDAKLARELFDEAYALQGYARRQRAHGRSRDRADNARDARAEARRLLDEARERERRAVRAILDAAQVVCATLAGLGGSDLSAERFDLALLDEATQATEPMSLWSFLRAPKVVLAGDHRQLPPTILSEEAAKGGLALSLFERLLEDAGAPASTMLKEQYRMHEEIMAFPSAEMYGGQLRAHPSVARRKLEELAPLQPLDAPPVLFLDTAGKGFDDEVAPGTESRVNPGEAALVIARLNELLAAGLAAAEIAVIAPYSAQVSLLRSLSQGVDGVEVDTVDAFQGREKEAVLVSLTRANPDGELGFLTDLRRINVALTRAKRHLFLVGDSATLSRHPFYQRLLDRVQAQGGYRSAWEWPEP
jgi:ATP-dependent RNA/DNA helicase IGHMBP2